TKQETKRLIRLVNENLDYEKIRPNQVSLQLERIDLFDLYELVKDQLQATAEEKENNIQINVPQGMEIVADYDRMLQIILNIVKNSIQFTEKGDIILTGSESETESVLTLSDTGQGMDRETIENIWERFYKAGISRTTNAYGEFGLGLSIVKELVHIHGGSIEVSSEKGQGTTFTITLPKVNLPGDI